MSFAKAVLDEVTHSGAPSLRERLTRGPPDEDVDVHRAEDLPDLLHLGRIAKVPPDRHSGEVVRMGLQGFRIEIGTEHDLHSRVLEPEAHATRSGEEVGCDQLSRVLIPQAPDELDQTRDIVAVILVLRQSQRLATVQPQRGR